MRLDAPGVSFLVTPPDAPKEPALRARTTSQFLREFGAQVAINGDFYYPARNGSLLDRIPRPGDPIVVQGLAASCGKTYGMDRPRRRWPTTQG